VKISALIVVTIIAISVFGCSSSVRFSSSGTTTSGLHSEHELEGFASYYADKFQGRQTANGDIFDQSKLTAAHKTLPFGTIVIVENINNGKTVTVIINDRGPFVKGRIIDLSYSAAEKIGMINEGIVPVRLRIVE
jgi:rare lipoprotein A